MSDKVNAHPPLGEWIEDTGKLVQWLPVQNSIEVIPVTATGSRILICTGADGRFFQAVLPAELAAQLAVKLGPA